MIVVIVTDETPVTDETERMLRRLGVQHDLIWLTVRDADPVIGRPFDKLRDPRKEGRRPFDGLRDPRKEGSRPFDGLRDPGRDARRPVDRLRDPARRMIAEAATHRRDVDSGWAVPDFVHGDPEVMAELAAQEAADTARRHDVLRRLEITHAEFGGLDTAVPTLLTMLNRRSHARL